MQTSMQIGEQPGQAFRYERAFTVYRAFNGLGFAAIATLGVLGLTGSSKPLAEDEQRKAMLIKDSSRVITIRMQEAQLWLENPCH